MNNENTVREFLDEVFWEVRAFEEDGVIWFVASDVAKVLEYRDANKITCSLDEDEKDTRTLCTLDGNQKMTIINESGLYSTVMSITKKNIERYEKAQKFKKWICGTVIPTLRKDGMYVDKEEKVVTGEMSEDELILKAMTCMQSKIERLKKENDRYSKFIGDKMSKVTKTELARRLNTSPQRLSKILKEEKIYTPKSNDISQWFLDLNNDINVTITENNKFIDKNGEERVNRTWSYTGEGAVRVVKFLEEKGKIKYSDNEGFTLTNN